MITRSHYVNGKIDPSGAHSAAIKLDEQTYQLACVPGSCNIPIVARPCASEYNGSQFARLPPPLGQSQWTCEALRAQQGSLFPSPRPPSPNRCTRDEVSRLP